MKTLPLATIAAATLGVLAARGQVVTDHYIAVFKEHVRDHPAAARNLAAQHGLALGHVYQTAVKGFSFGGSSPAAAALARRPEIAYVEADQVFQAWGQTIPTGINRADVEVAVALDGVDDAVDVDVAIIDTGLDSDHPDLRIDPNGVRFYISRNRVRSDSNWEDANGHGTHVGGTVAALDNDFGVVGVAPGARLTAVRVLDQNGDGTTSTVLAGVDWVAARADRFEVANMSVGGGFSATLNDAVRKAVGLGVVFVVAAGNEGQDAANFSPASEPSAITVSALADSNGLPGGGGPATAYGADDTFATFSNYGSVVDISAPGVDILSTYVGGGYAIGSGTSMASPHVAGAAALYVATHGLTKSAAGVAAVADALKDAAWYAGDTEYLKGGDRDAFPEPLLNVGPLVGPVNARPVVLITAPEDDDVFASGIPITFTGTAEDAEDGIVTDSLVWTSDLVSESIGAGGSISVNLPDGTHTITATVTDSDGATGSASVTITVGTPPPLSGLVVPAGFEAVDDDGYGGTLSSPLRLQEVYSAGHFSGVSGPVTITGMAFRLDNISSKTVGTANLRVRLSTTSAQPDNLSPVFASNVGSGVIEVFPRGDVAFTATTGSTPNRFDIVITFATPFVYNPAAGNLLVDIITYSAVPGAWVDGSNEKSDGASRAWSTNINATRASARDSGADVILLQFQP